MRTQLILVYFLYMGVMTPQFSAKTLYADEAGKSVSVTIDVLPVVTLRENETTPLTLRFRNDSSMPFTYFGGTPGTKGAKTPNRLELRLRQEGKEMNPKSTGDSLIEFPHNLQTLPPGKFVDVRWLIPDDYLPLKPGRYEVWAHYVIAEGNSNTDGISVTPLSLDKRILWLDITKGEKQPEQEAEVPK